MTEAEPCLAGGRHDMSSLRGSAADHARGRQNNLLHENEQRGGESEDGTVKSRRGPPFMSGRCEHTCA